MVHRKVVNTSRKRTRRKERSKSRSRVKRTRSKMKRSRVKRIRSKMKRSRTKMNKNKSKRKKGRKEMKGGGWEGDYEWFTENFKRRVEIGIEGWQKALGKLKSIRQNSISMVWSPYEFRILEIGGEWEKAKQKDDDESKGRGEFPYLVERNALSDRKQWSENPMWLNKEELEDNRLKEIDLPNADKKGIEVKYRVRFCNATEISYKTVVFAYNYCKAGKREKKSPVFSALVDKYTNLVKEYLYFRDYYLKKDEKRWSYMQADGQMWTPENAGPVGTAWKNKMIKEANTQIKSRNLMKSAVGATLTGAAILGTGGIAGGIAGSALGAHGVFKGLKKSSRNLWKQDKSAPGAALAAQLAATEAQATKAAAQAAKAEAQLAATKVAASAPMAPVAPVVMATPFESEQKTINVKKV